VTIPDLRQNIRETENALSILLGRNPGGIARDSINNQRVRIDLQTGIPLQLLVNRPDVQEAEYQLRYYFELTNVARAYFYPSLTITAAGGLSNVNISQLFSASSLFGNIIGGLVQPIFNQGLNKQRLRVAQAQQEEYIALFKKTLLAAGQDVSNALYNYQAATEKMKIRSLQIGFLEKSVEFTKELLKYTANTNYTDVLTSEQSLLAAQLSSVSDKVQQLQAMVALYRSLGGGWK
jgi:outer membrane protein TolC